MANKTDVVIVGAGPSGLTMACALAETGLDITLVDTQLEGELAVPKMDGRDIAMTHTSQSILRGLGVWQRFDNDNIHPLKDAKVCNEDIPQILQFERSDDAVAPLGFLVSNHHIRKALFEQASEHSNIHFVLGSAVASASTCENKAEVRLESGETFQANLLIAADSRFSNIRRMMGIGASMKDYGRVMLVCNMTHTKSHQNTARESFLYGKTCAILPLSENRSSIVITVPARDSYELSELSDEAFNRKAEEFFGEHLGKMTLVSERFCYPLVGAYSNRFIAQRFALVGDAAVGMHPVTAHGYNLAVRSADTLATQIKLAIKDNKDIANPWGLRNYELRHQLLAMPIYRGTNAIVNLFTNDHPVAKVARKAALTVGQHLPGFKKLIVHRLTHVA